jgi:hypothetical protein
MGGPCGWLGFYAPLRHGWLAASVITNSKNRNLLAVCFHFTSCGRPLRDSSDIIFFGWPLRRVWYLCTAADWCDSYEIPTMVDGKATTEIRMIVYASGCEIQQFVLERNIPESTRSSNVNASRPLSFRDISCQTLWSGTPMPSWLSPTWLIGRTASMELATGLLLSSVSQLSLRTRTECFKSTCPISALTLRLRLHDKEQAFGSCCATPRLGTTSHLIWNLRSRSFGSKSTACESCRTIPTTSSSLLSLSCN